MSDKFSGILTETRPLQPENALSPITTTESGISTDVRLIQPEKALFPICVIVLAKNFSIE